jgi:hypothetical protein
MSRNSSFFFIFMTMLFSVLLNFFMTTPSYAQLGSGTSSGPTKRAPRQPITYPMPGLPDIRVNAAGDLAGSVMNGCPFESGAGNIPENYQKAFDAAKGKDPNDCPFFNFTAKRQFAYSSCGGFYKKLSEASGSHPNPNMVCCHFSAGIGRRECLKSYNILTQQVSANTSNNLTQTGTISKNSKDQGVEQAKAINAEKKKLADAEQSCFGDSLKRVGEFWAQKQEVLCYKAVKNLIKDLIKKKTAEAVDQLDNNTTITASATGTAGAFTAIAPVPSPYGIAAGIKNAIKFGVKISKIASDADALLTRLNEGCGALLPDLQALQSFRSTLTNTLSCQGLSSLMERQLTQCVRVNLTANFSLPQFSLLLQCPININVSANIGADGFNCFSTVSAGSPVSGNFGGRSLISGNGGLENLFNGNCFGNDTNDANGGLDPDSGSDGSSSSTPTTGVGSRIPGIDCADLDTNSVMKQENIQGKVYLNAGSATSGWAVGATETITKVDASGNIVNAGLSVTRCDYFEKGRPLRTAYVYGSGSSCNAGASGFLDGGFETNSACYSGGYTPAASAAVPDACMYPAACLDTSGNFNASRKGAEGCPSNVIPTFMEGNNYNVFTSGGLSGGTTESRSCSEFNGQLKSTVVQCCDPQTQDCRNRDANVPLCQCDEGDASNAISDPATGSCAKGGKATCCSPRLNGGAAGCGAMVGTSGICADEANDQCTDKDDPATYTGPDGRPVTLKAADLALAKPSPYVYLFVRPDAQMNGQQCCMTEWCNICPQHYANAYGLSLARSSLNQPTSDAGNNAILGKGWPFTSSTNELGITTYDVGVNPLPVLLWNPFNRDEPKKVTISNPVLNMGIDSEIKPLDTAIDACNNLSSWKVIYSRDGEFTNGDMGFPFPNYNNPKDGNIGYAQIKGMSGGTETPMGYLNRMRAAIKMPDGTPLAPIELCSNTVKICYGNSASSSFATPNGSATAYTSTSTPAPVVTTTPTATTTAPATTTSTESTTSSSSAGATTVPSATSGSSGQASGSLY